MTDVPPPAIVSLVAIAAWELGVSREKVREWLDSGVITIEGCEIVFHAWKLDTTLFTIREVDP